MKRSRSSITKQPGAISGNRQTGAKAGIEMADQDVRRKREKEKRMGTESAPSITSLNPTSLSPPDTQSYPQIRTERRPRRELNGEDHLHVDNSPLHVNSHVPRSVANQLCGLQRAAHCTASVDIAVRRPLSTLLPYRPIVESQSSRIPTAATRAGATPHSYTLHAFPDGRR
jgi:hypothetical protein